MIYIKNIKYLFTLIILGILLTQSCVHKKNDFIQNVINISKPYQNRNTLSSFIKLNYYDLAPYLSKKGLTWAPFILPVEDNIEITEGHLLLGYLAADNDFIAPPQNGSCSILQTESKYESKTKKLYTFSSSNSNPSQDAFNVLLLLDPEQFQPYAVVKLNENGIAKCYLPVQNYHISYNFGFHREEANLQSNENKETVDIPFYPKGFLEISTQPTSFLSNGDLIRIGRKYSIKNNLKINKANNQSLVANNIEGDLFKKSNFSSQNIGIDESLFTSFLVGKKTFKLRLEAGKYNIAVLRKNSLICMQEVSIQENESTSIGCPNVENDDIEQAFFSKNEYNINFDATFYPDRLNQELHFHDWLMSQKNLFMPILVQDNTSGETNNQNDKTFSFLFKNNKNDLVYEFPQSFSSPNNVLHNSIPTFGTGLEKIAKGAIPFLNYCSLKFQFPLKPNQIFTNSYAEMSNGTEIKLFEPYLSAEGHLTSIREQHFRIHISVPKWNSTNVIEMYINGNLHRRWILSRGDVSVPFSITLNEKTFEDKNFTVKFVTWGNPPLPDFLFGLDNEMPFAKTKDYQVIVIGK